MFGKPLPLIAAAFLLGGCGLWSDEPPQLAVAKAGLEKQTVNPGDSFGVTYVVDYSEDWSDVIAIQIAGLPENTRAAGTQLSLPVPSGSGVARTATVMLRPPATAGEYPLTLRTQTKSGMTAVARLGTLIINDVPGTISFAQFDPASHSVSQCTAPTMPVLLKYAVEDPNGASDVIDIKLTRATANPPVAGSPIPLTGQAPQGLSPQALSPQGGEITPPPAAGGNARLLSAPGSAAEGGNFAEVSLPGAAKDTTARETLNRPIRINCRVPAPVVWRWQVVGVDRDAVTGNLRPTGAARLDYFSTQ